MPKDVDMDAEILVTKKSVQELALILKDASPAMKDKIVAAIRMLSTYGIAMPRKVFRQKDLCRSLTLRSAVTQCLRMIQTSMTHCQIWLLPSDIPFLVTEVCIEVGQQEDIRVIRMAVCQ